MPPERAFVVQFRQFSESGPGWFSGRVEHMMSGQNATFVTAQELVEFIRRVMNQRRVEDQVEDRIAVKTKKGE
jgi:hypothetical protein